jgi:hypothetical protein
MVSVPQDSQEYISRRVVMKRISVLLFALVVCFATAMQAQAPAPKPNPEVKKLHAVLGHWTFEGEQKPGPLGPAGKLTGEQTCRMILGGFFVQCQWTEKGPAGETRGLEIDGYDPVNKNYPLSVYESGGGVFSGVSTFSGNTNPWTGKYVLAGKQYWIKGTDTLAADLMSFTRKSEMSPDGKTWAPLGEAKYTKVQPAPKK